MEIDARVKYIRIDNADDKNSGYYPPVGTLGTVTESDEINICVRWDSGTREGEWYCSPEDVEYIGRHSYPIEIVKCVRQHLGFDEDNESMDCEINDMSPDEVFGIVCNWNGLINYAHKIKSWVNDIYGANI